MANHETPAYEVVQEMVAEATKERYGTEPITITLRTPIKYGSRLVTEIVVRPVKAKFMRGLDLGGGGMAATLLLASKLTGEVSEVIDELSGPDLRDVLEAVNGFLLAIQATG